MRANPKLTEGVNVWWIKFFVLAVFATMYVRDHCRPAFHKAVGITPSDYDFRVFRLCSEISRQTFPLTLDLDNPAFKAGLDRLLGIAQKIEQADAEGGLLGQDQEDGLCRRRGAGVRAALSDPGQGQSAAGRNPARADLVKRRPR